MLEKLTLEEMKNSFPFEPMKMNRLLFSRGEEYMYAKMKKRMERNMSRDEQVIMKNLKKIYADMPKTKINLRIYEKLNFNVSKLIHVEDNSFIQFPLIYDENSGKFYLSRSFDGFEPDSELEAFRKSSIEGAMDFMLNKIGGLALRVYDIEIPYKLFSREQDYSIYNKSYTGKVIKAWCEENKNDEDAEEILAEYFSDGKSLTSYVYYSVVWKPGIDRIMIYRDLEMSPKSLVSNK
jgi:hypothetical protein